MRRPVFTLYQVTPPTAEPVHRAEFKMHQRVDINDEDSVIDGYISAARRTLESEYHFQAITATWRYRLAELQYEQDCGLQYIPLPRPPLRSVSSFVYVATDGTSTTWSSTNYTVDTESVPGRLVLAYGASWPSVRAQAQAITITYQAGYATPVTASAAADTLTLSGSSGTNGDIVRLSNSGGTLPGGVSANTDYYVSGTTGQTIQLSTASGTTGIDITDAGSGQTFLGEVPFPIRVGVSALAAHYYENREPVNVGNIVNEIPMHIKNMLSGIWDGVLY